MQHIKRSIISTVFLAAFMGAVATNAQTSLYVSIKGNDNNPGTKSKPFASIGRAVLTARKIHGAVFIKLYGGTYRLGQPVIFVVGVDGIKLPTLCL